MTTEISTQKTPAKKPYDRFAIHRKVRHQYTTPDGIAIAKTKSFTQQDGEYSPVVNLANGACSCTCPDFEYRKARLHPQINKPETLCKHLVRYITRLEQRGDLQPECASSACETHHEAPRNEARPAWTPPARRDWREMSREERDAYFDF